MNGASGSKVYFANMDNKHGESLPSRLGKLILAAGLGDVEMDRRYVAIKMHFGELGNVSFIRPNFAKVVADAVKENGGRPFLTDCNTLYVGSRKNGLDHLATAAANGFNQTTTGCDVIIADGVKGLDDYEVEINGELVKKAFIGRAIYDSDMVISLSHFKLHEMTGIGGALKNLGMGSGSIRGKRDQHSAGKPTVSQKKCKGCGSCAKACGQDAIVFEDKKAKIIESKCVGCGRCIGACAFDAVEADTDAAGDVLCKKMAEYAAATVLGKPNFHIVMMTDINPECDCYPFNRKPIMRDIGMLASFDPVALDQACADLCLAEGKKLGHDDVINEMWPTTDWEVTLDHAERIGLGTRMYELVDVSKG